MNVHIVELILCESCTRALVVFLAVEMHQLGRLRLSCSMQLQFKEMSRMLMLLGRLAVGKYKIEVQIDVCVAAERWDRLVDEAGLSERSVQTGEVLDLIPGDGGEIVMLSEAERQFDHWEEYYTHKEHNDWLQIVEGREKIWLAIKSRFERSYDAARSRDVLRYHN